jgi:hypothetical protein
MGTRTSLSLSSLSGVWPSLLDPVHSQFINHHLDLEAELEDFIRSQLRDPDRAKIEQLNFPRKVALARAIAGPQPDDHLWDILLKFNETRNAIAHRLKTPPETRFAELSGLVTNALPQSPTASDEQVMMSAFIISTWFIRDIKQSLLP